MTHYKLTYFDFDGGRGEPARIAFHIGGIDFEDHRISFQQFAEQRSGYRFNSAPILEIDGQGVTQSNAMNRYIGKFSGLYPEDPIQALYCDETMDAVEDITHYVVQTFKLQGEEMKAAREQLRDGWMTTYIVGVNELLMRGGQYFADNRLTMADLKVFVWISGLRKGLLDHIPADLVDTLAPALADHEERIKSDERVLAYYRRNG